MEHFYEIILKSGHWPWRRSRLKLFFFSSIFSSSSHFVQPSRTILAILVKGHKINTSLNFKIGSLAAEEMSFKGFSIFRSGCHFVQPSGTILAILVEGHWRYTYVEIF